MASEHAGEVQGRVMDGIMAVSEIQDFIDLHNVVDDDDLQDAINTALKCIANPNISHATARKLLLKMQGYAFKFKMQGLVYMQIHKGAAATKENIKKNAYFYASEQCHELAQTLKYLARENSF